MASSNVSNFITCSSTRCRYLHTEIAAQLVPHYRWHAVPVPQPKGKSGSIQADVFRYMDQRAAIWLGVALMKNTALTASEGSNSADGFYNRAFIAGGQLAGQDYRRTVFDRELLQSVSGTLETRIVCPVSPNRRYSEK